MLLSSLRRNGAIAAALLLASPTVAALSAKDAKVRAEFMRAMKKTDARAARRAANAQRKARLRKNLLAKAVPVVPSSQSKTKPAELAMTPRRRMEDGGNGGDDDDYWANNNYNDDVDYGAFGFDVTAYSLKYTGCAAISTYSDEQAEDEDGSGSVFAVKRFVTFRLCNSESCDNSYGCSSDYGEYMMEMDDYLENMQRYNEERFEAYCEYCEQCMMQDYQNWLNQQYGGNNNQRQLDGAAGDDAAGDDAAAAEGDDAAGDDAAVEEDDSYEHACDEFDECTKYMNVCDIEAQDGQQQDEGDDAAEAEEEEEELDITAFFECSEFNDGYNYAYLGPHCASDGKTILIGIYSDEYCNEYIGDKVDINDFTGYEIEDDALSAYYPEDCIACKESDQMYELTDEDAEDDNDVTELCEQLYEQAAKCNKYFEDAQAASYYSYMQMDNEDLVCSFIESVVVGTYDEYGMIILDNSDDGGSSSSSGSRVNDYYNKAKHYVEEEVSPLQIFGLVASILGCVVLSLWACILHSSITKKAPWRPRRGRESDYDPTEISRQNSGIVMGRSRSGGSYHHGTMT